ncbi:hypothetical protein WA026_011576 [Henosepilachna vigintioctopunctata]|uniref:CUB domain-containing protein n=1 Tax=Henosepilachna vigintioctopunctata TaxID=420089 RepID=A0AAW1TT86_9CUCU
MINRTLTLCLLIVIFTESVLSVDFLTNRNTSQILDISDICIKATKHEYFMPSGTGGTDGLVLLVTQPKDLIQCELNFNIRRDNDQSIQIIVVEFLPTLATYEETLSVCNTSFGEFFMTFRDEEGETATGCEMFTKSIYGNPYLVYLSHESSVSLLLNSFGYLNPIKITASSGRSLALGENCIKAEIECTVSQKAVCVDRRLRCDGHINCGMYEDQDEDHKICRKDEYSNYWLIALAAVAILVLIYGIFVYCIKLHITKTAGTFFIFNEDKENKLVIRSQLNTHDWLEYKKEITTEPTGEATTVKESGKV